MSLPDPQTYAMPSTEFWLTLGVLISNWTVLPVLLLRIDPVLCWFTCKENVSDIPEPQRSIGRMVIFLFITFPLNFAIFRHLKE